MKVISVQTMRELDRKTIDQGTSGKILMARAGQGVYDAMMKFLEGIHPRHRRRVVVPAGSGNNGGDAFVVAALLSQQAGLDTTVYCVKDKKELTGEARFYAEALPEKVDFKVIEESLPQTALAPGTVVLDGLLGTGISGPLRDPYATLIRQINDSGCPVIAIDVPSGLNGDTGDIATVAVQADLTVTMACPKSGMLTPSGLRCSGQLRCVDIGISSVLLDTVKAEGEAVFAGDAEQLLTRRPPDGHKGTFGHTLIIGGSKNFTGAPVLSGIGALRSGCGLATIAVPGSIRPYISAAPQALIFIPVEDHGIGQLTAAGLDQLKAAAVAADSIVLGPGIGRNGETKAVVKAVLSLGLPTVMDADALKLAASMGPALKEAEKLVLTPHPGEMKGLLQGLGMTELLDADRPRQAGEVARRLQAIVVLKGQGTVIAAPSGSRAVNTSGSTALASGGSGDVLAGLIGGLMAQGFAPIQAAKLGVFVHGRAAELSPHMSRAMTADDLPARISRVFQELTPFP